MMNYSANVEGTYTHGLQHGTVRRLRKTWRNKVVRILYSAPWTFVVSGPRSEGHDATVARMRATPGEYAIYTIYDNGDMDREEFAVQGPVQEKKD